MAVVTEVDSALEGAKSPPHFNKPKASPKPRLFSGLKKEVRSRSNSSVLSIRRFSTEGILGERMDSIGRRLSRDLTNSPPDLGRKFETFGKNEHGSNKFDTFSGSALDSYGISKSNEGLSTGRYDTFSGKSGDKPDMPIKLKKKGNKRPTISFESYHPDKTERSPEQCSEYELPSVKEGLEPPIYQEDRNKAVIRHKLHKELRDKYGPTSTRPDGVGLPEDGSNRIECRPPLPKRNNDRTTKHQRQKSLDNLDAVNGSSVRPPAPSPRTARGNTNPARSSPKLQVSFERLSREDLLRLSDSSQMEIHEYLKNSVSDRQAEPP